MERITILRVFEQVQGDKVLAGRLLGISRATLYRKLKRYQIPLRPPLGATHHVIENSYVSETGAGR